MQTNSIEHSAQNGASAPAKQKSVGFRIDSTLKERLEAICGHTGVDRSTIGRELVRALVTHFEETGELSFPMEIRTGKNLQVRIRKDKEA